MRFDKPDFYCENAYLYLYTFTRIAMRPAALLLLLTLTACTQQAEEAQTAYSSELKELIPLKGHDPYEEGVLTDPYLKHRLVKLLGQGTYDTLRKLMYDCSPIGFNHDLLYWVGYDREHPEASGGAIIIDLKKDVIYVGIEIDNHLTVFSEAGDVSNHPDKLQRWLFRREQTGGRASE